MPEKTSDCPRKMQKKVDDTKISNREKNKEKYQKPNSRALFIFSGKKKGRVGVGYGQKQQSEKGKRR